MRSVLLRLFAICCVLVGAVLAGQSAALASPPPTGPVQPGVAPLSGVTFPSTGDIGRAGGLTYTFSGVTGLMSQFQTLEWGPAGPDSVQLSMNGPISPANTLTFNTGASDLANGKAVWMGTAQYPIAQPPGTIQLLTRFTMTAKDSNNVPITGFNATSGYGDGATANVLGDFSATLLFEVSDNNGTSWMAAKDYFDTHQNVPGNEMFSSFTGAFFYRLANVPVASVSPSPFDFGTQVIGQPSGVQTFTVTNTGNADLHMQSATTSGSSDFSITSDTCSGNPVTPGNACTIGVTFTPSQTGSRTGTLTISDDAADSPQVVSLSGTGTQPTVSLSPNSLAFGSQAVGTTSAAKTVTITNNGTADLHVSGVSVGGANAGDFAASSSGCGTVPSGGGTCTVSVKFTPAAAGARSATLNIASDAPSSPDQVSLSGTGLNSRLSLSPNPMNFGNVLVGQSKTITLTFSNSGSDPSHLTGPPTVGGPDGNDFALVFPSFNCVSDNTGNPAIPPGNSCSVDITFTPGGVGARSATLTFPNDSSDGPQQLTLKGNGTNPGISVAPSSLSFGSQGTGTTSAAQPVVVTSSGTSALTVSSASVTGPFQVSNDGCSGAGPIAPAGTCTVQVVFQPTALGPASGTLTITSDGGTKTVALSGTGVAVADLGISIGATPNPIKTGPKAFLTYTVTLKNAGPSQASGIAISDPLPSFTQFQSLSQPAGATCSTPAVGASGTLKCNLASLNVGATAQFTIVVKVVASKAMTITNTVTATSQSVDPDPSDNQASASTVVK
jgi:uncharacterized repeat protein (TIGR01451 family)